MSRISTQDAQKAEKTAVVIQHVAFEDLGSLEPVLQQQGFQIRFWEAARDPLADLDPLAADLMIILGGPIGAYEEESYPFLLSEFQLIEKRLQADRPLLGICLGAQLMARVLGAAVYPGGSKEMGWKRIYLTAAGQGSLLSCLDATTPVLHWHGDSFDLPPGSIHLAGSDLYPHQAFAYGQSALGLQFHLEVTPTGLERWYVGHAYEIAATEGISVAQLRQDTACYGFRLERQARQIWHNWLKSLEEA
ncbi:MAG: glutamine amidotransferase [Thermostichus sp. DG_1_6_bins_120]